MGDHFSAPVKVRSERANRGILALLLVVGVLAAITITGSGIAGAADLSFGGYSPYVSNGGVDLNFDGAITSSDDSTDFFVDTELVNGYLDCDMWSGTNGGEDGDGVIGVDDDCALQGYFFDNVDTVITVVDGRFTSIAVNGGDEMPIPDAWRLPWLYNTSDVTLDSSDYETSDWAWVVEAGFVDYDHDGTTAESADDDAQNFWSSNGDVENGLVDVNDDGSGTTADDCSKCFFGMDVANGKVQATMVSNPFLGGVGPQGLPGANGVSGRVAIAASSSTNSLNKSKSATCSGTTKVLGGGYSLTGDTATLAHLTVVANGPAGGTAWRVRVIEATPTSGTWAVTVTAICATA